MENEILHQMLRLEAHRPGADLALAIVLLKAWEEFGKDTGAMSKDLWLKEICPCCIAMLEEVQTCMKEQNTKVPDGV